LTSAVRAAVFSADPQQPIDSVTTVARFLNDSLGPQRFRATLLLLLGGIGVALAALGIYGITARAVEERTAELAVRLALGATPAAVGGMVMWQSMRVVLAGLTVGGVLAAVAGSIMVQLLPNLDKAERWVAIVPMLMLAPIAAAAAFVPARRAVSLPPTVALRS
jgi:ABC-type antimicrobial peptide transport system permease subunit